jgi:hypothetical protein
MEIKRLIREVDFDALIDEFAEVCPVFEVPGTAVDLVDQDASRLSLAQGLEHLCPDRAAFLRRRLPLFEPIGNREVRASCVSLNCVPLFGKGDTPFSLLRRGDADVAEICLQWFSRLVYGGIDLCLDHMIGLAVRQSV